VITPQVSGVFDVWVELTGTGFTGGSAPTLQLFSTEALAAGPILINNAVASAVKGTNVGVDAQGGITTSTTSIALSNTGTVHLLQQQILSSSLISPTTAFSLGGIFDFNNGSLTLNPFTLGVDCAFYLRLTGSTTITSMALQFSVAERLNA